MRQAFHILKKDIRYLRFEVTAVPVLLVLSAVAHWRFGDDPSLLFFAPFYLVSVAMIVRLIHAESIVGDRQFWVTRPYRWTSLIAAKVFFLFLFLILPITLVRLACLSVLGFPLTASLLPLLWSPVHLIGPISVLVVLATVTSGFRHIILITVVLTALNVPLDMFFPSRPSDFIWPWTIEWINSAIFGLLMGGVMLTVLYLQYKHRMTKVSRVLLIVAFATARIVCWALPPSLGLAVQAALPMGNSAEAARFTTVDVRFYRPDQQAKPDYPPPTNARIARIGMHRPANGGEGMLDGFRITLEADDGRVWTSPWKFGPYGLQAITQSEGGFDEWFTIDPTFLEAERKNPVTLRATFYVTVLGDVQPPILLPVTPRNADDSDSRTVHRTAHYVDAGSGFQCAAVPGFARNDSYYSAEVFCRTPLAWPAVALTVDRVSKNGLTFVNALENRNMSYSPFGLASLFVLAVRTAQVVPRDNQDEGEYRASLTTALSLDDHVVVHMRKPIAHFKREIVQRVRLDD